MDTDEGEFNLGRLPSPLQQRHLCAATAAAASDTIRRDGFRRYYGHAVVYKAHAARNQIRAAAGPYDDAGDSPDSDDARLLGQYYRTRRLRSLLLSTAGRKSCTQHTYSTAN